MPETTAQRAAREAAAAQRARERAAAITQTPRLARFWPQALYHYDYERRDRADVSKIGFVVQASLPNILQAERSRLLARCLAHALLLAVLRQHVTRLR